MWPSATFRGAAAIRSLRSEADIEQFSVCTEPVAFDPELTFVRKPSLRHTYLPERVVRPFTLLEKSRIFGRIHFCL